MAFQQDWIMRQIEMITQFTARVLFQKDTVCYEIAQQDQLSNTDLLYVRLLALLEKGQFCRAEDMLFAHLQEGDQNHVRLVLDFYQRLNDCSDTTLTQGGLPRDEVQQGLQDALKALGVRGLVQE